MKRSQMIENILASICGSYELNDKKVSEILDVIEEYGMLPPERDEGHWDLEHVHYAHKWDEEDEADPFVNETVEQYQERIMVRHEYKQNFEEWYESYKKERSIK